MCSRTLATYRAMNTGIEAGLLHSSHTPTLGGLAVAFALAALGGDLGAEINLDAAPHDGDLRDDALLFAESNSRFVVTCAPEQAAALEEKFHGLPCAQRRHGHRRAHAEDPDRRRRAWRPTSTRSAKLSRKRWTESDESAV